KGRSLPIQSRKRLEHRLSDIIELMNAGRSRDKSSLSELDVCQALDEAECGSRLSALLGVTIASLPVPNRSVRRTDVRTRGDNYGNFVVYPPPARVPAELDALAAYVDSGA